MDVEVVEKEQKVGEPTWVELSSMKMSYSNISYTIIAKAKVEELTRAIDCISSRLEFKRGEGMGFSHHIQVGASMVMT